MQYWNMHNPVCRKFVSCTWAVEMYRSQLMHKQEEQIGSQYHITLSNLFVGKFLLNHQSIYLYSLTFLHSDSSIFQDPYWSFFGFIYAAYAQPTSRLIILAKHSCSLIFFSIFTYCDDVCFLLFLFYHCVQYCNFMRRPSMLNEQTK